jgi:hypothetical protein
MRTASRDYFPSSSATICLRSRRYTVVPLSVGAVQARPKSFEAKLFPSHQVGRLSELRRHATMTMAANRTPNSKTITGTGVTQRAPSRDRFQTS